MYVHSDYILIHNENFYYTIKTYFSRSESFGIREVLYCCVSFRNKLPNIFLETCKKIGESHMSNHTRTKRRFLPLHEASRFVSIRFSLHSIYFPYSSQTLPKPCRDISTTSLLIRHWQLSH